MLKSLKLPVAAAAAIYALMGALSVETSAATLLSAQVRIGSQCSDADSSKPSASASCSVAAGVGLVAGDADAIAEFGSLAVSANTTGSSTSGSSTGGHTIWSSSAFFQDELSFNIQNGSLLIPVEISGTTSLEYEGPFIGGPITSNFMAGVMVQINSQTVFKDFRQDFPQITTPTSIHETVGAIGINYIELAFTNGVLVLLGHMLAYSYCGGATICFALTDFLSTALILGVSVLDTAGNLIPDATISSASGFDYLAGAGQAVVPLPAAFPLFATALAGMGLLGWRQKRKAAASV